MKKYLSLMTLLVVGLLSGAARADMLKSARVEGGALFVDGKTYTIDTSNKKGKELAGKSGTFDIDGKIDTSSQKVVVNSYNVAKADTLQKEPMEKVPGSDPGYDQGQPR